MHLDSHRFPCSTETILLAGLEANVELQSNLWLRWRWAWYVMAQGWKINSYT